MFTLFVHFVLASSPTEISPGPGSRSSSTPCQSLCQERQTSKQWQQLFESYLLQIVDGKQDRVFWFLNDLIDQFEETGYSKENRQLRVLNGLIKRIRHFYKKSKMFIDRERERVTPNSRLAHGMTGPTPEILKIAVEQYVPTQRQEFYNNFLTKHFSNLDEEKLIFLEACSDIYTWLENIGGENKQGPKIRRAVHPKPWRP